MALYASESVGAVTSVVPAASVVRELVEGAERFLSGGGRPPADQLQATSCQVLAAHDRPIRELSRGRTTEAPKRRWWLRRAADGWSRFAGGARLYFVTVTVTIAVAVPPFPSLIV